METWPRSVKICLYISRLEDLGVRTGVKSKRGRTCFIHGNGEGCSLQNVRSHFEGYCTALYRAVQKYCSTVQYELKCGSDVEVVKVLE